MPQTFLGQPPYDQADVHDFAVERTGLLPEQVRQVLSAQARYQVLLGLAPTSVLTEGEQIVLKEELDAHRDLVPDGCRGAPGICVWHLEVEYILRTTNCPLQVVADTLSQELGYQVSIGITHPAVLADYLKWAPCWLGTKLEPQN